MDSSRRICKIARAKTKYLLQDFNSSAERAKSNQVDQMTRARRSVRLSYPAMNPPFLPSSSMYCRNCYYDLRGLPSNRWPECGSVFNPNDGATFSRSPGPQRIKKLLRAIIPPSQPPARSGSVNAQKVLENKVRQLQQDNDLLWDHVAWLLCCLLEKGIIRRHTYCDSLVRVFGPSVSSSV